MGVYLETMVVYYSDYLSRVWKTYYALIHRNQLGGYLNLTSHEMGIAIALIAGVIASLSNYIFMTYIEPGLVDEMIELGRRNLEESGNSLRRTIEMSLEMSRKFITMANGSYGVIALYLWG